MKFYGILPRAYSALLPPLKHPEMGSTLDRAQNFPDLKQGVADKFWELYEQKPILEKFELAILLKNQPDLSRGIQTYKSVKDLVSLRNALTHFKPKWESENDTHAKLSRQIAGYFFRSAARERLDFGFTDPNPGTLKERQGA